MLQEKRTLRKELRTKIKELSSQEKSIASELVITQLLAHEQLKNASTILSFWPLNIEPEISSLNINLAEKKQMLLPKIVGDILELRCFDGMNSLEPEAIYGILEPTGKIWTDLAAIDLILVPGLGFTKTGGRIGKGKGFYDKLLRQTPAYTIGLGFNCQLLDSIPMDEHDIYLNEVICQ